MHSTHLQTTQRTMSSRTTSRIASAPPPPAAPAITAMLLEAVARDRQMHYFTVYRREYD